MAYDGKPVPKKFREFDLDQSGQLGREEFLCQVVKHFNQIDKNDDGHLLGKEVSALRHAQGRADEDGDKKVSLIEFMETSAGAFNAFDEDKSGSLSELEFSKGLQALTKK
jgi:hypothetical protein